MKRILALILLAVIAISAYAQEQTDTLKVSQPQQTESIDSLSAKCLAAIVKKIDAIQPRYKMYKTENTYNLLKLDTATGRIWQVQYGMNNSADRMEVPVDDTSLLWGFEEPRAGRYELYPTNNLYNFILIDTEMGYTYQVQWNTNPKQRFRIRIY